MKRVLASTTPVTDGGGEKGERKEGTSTCPTSRPCSREGRMGGGKKKRRLGVPCSSAKKGGEEKKGKQEKKERRSAGGARNICFVRGGKKEKKKRGGGKEGDLFSSTLIRSHSQRGERNSREEGKRKYKDSRLGGLPGGPHR